MSGIGDTTSHNNLISWGSSISTSHLKLCSPSLQPSSPCSFWPMASAQLQPSCVSGLSHCPRVWVLSRSQFNSPFLFGTEKVRRDTKSLDFGQQHTRRKDNLTTYLSLGIAIGHSILARDSNKWGTQGPRDGSLALSSDSFINWLIFCFYFDLNWFDFWIGRPLSLNSCCSFIRTD